jgi:hypothetical protein
MTEKVDGENNNMLKGAKPTKEEEEQFLDYEKKEHDYYAEWIRESLKTSINFANEVLRQLLTLCAALIGGSVVFLEKNLDSPPHLRTIVVLAFIAGLVCSFIGVTPYEHHATYDTKEFKREKIRALETKRRYIEWTCIFIAIGLFLAIALLYFTELNTMLDAGK